jgi:hypothetical protein
MFGPDICGGTKRTHFILTKKGKNFLIKNDIPCESDTFTHTYTLILKPDNTFRVLIDGEEKRAGSIEDEFEILEPKEINDPAQSKPADWVDEAQIDDPTDFKPEGYDDIKPTIIDPEATKPEDWDDDLDGEWEAPTISNPDFKVRLCFLFVGLLVGCCLVCLFACLVWFGLAWFGLVWFGLAWLGLAWFGLVVLLLVLFARDHGEPNALTTLPTRDLGFTHKSLTQPMLLMRPFIPSLALAPLDLKCGK